MNATTHTVVVRKPSTWSLSRMHGGTSRITPTEQTTLSTASNVREVLDVCSGSTHRTNKVTASGIGKATHVYAT